MKTSAKKPGSKENEGFSPLIALLGNPTLTFNDNDTGKAKTPNNPEKDIPTKPDKNPDPTIPKPGGNEPKKNDPTRIEEPTKTDPTRIDKPEKSGNDYKQNKIKPGNGA